MTGASGYRAGLDHFAVTRGLAPCRATLVPRSLMTARPMRPSTIAVSPALMRSDISENIACRWFCFLTIEDPMLDHSSISRFIDRIGRDGFAAIFKGLNDGLLRLGM